MDFDRLSSDIGSEITADQLSLLAEKAFERISFTFSPDHLERLAAIVHDDGNSDNDRLVASQLLENAVIASRGVYPLCQDTGTAQVFAWKDSAIHTDSDDTEALSMGIEKAYKTRNLRFSTTVADSLFEEHDPANNMPAQIQITATRSTAANASAYRLLFCAKGGGSSNKTAFIQGTKALLNEKSFSDFLRKQIPALGTAACPPYTIAVVVGGLSPEQNLLTLKLATTGYFDGDLPGWDYRVMGTVPLRIRDWEAVVLKIAAETGLGAQFGGRALASGACVLRLPRHGASCPVSIGVSCAAHRNLHGFIDRTGIYLERTESDPLSIPSVVTAIAFSRTAVTAPLPVDLDAGIPAIRASLAALTPGTPLLLTGRILVARDAAHARWKQELEKGKALPGYTVQYPIIYAGPAQTPADCVTGSFGPTTAGRMDDYADELMSRGAALITMAKGNRSEKWRKACAAWGGTYLGIIGGAAALIAERYITESTVLDYPDLGMEAVRLVSVRDLPAFVLINDQGRDFYASLTEKTQ